MLRILLHLVITLFTLMALKLTAIPFWDFTRADRFLMNLLSWDQQYADR